MMKTITSENLNAKCTDRVDSLNRGDIGFSLENDSFLNVTTLYM